MNKLFKLTIAFVFAFVLTGTAQDLTLDEILTKHFETMGTEKLSKLKSVEIDGKVISRGMEMPFIQKIKQNGKIRMEVTVQGNTMIQAFDGKNAWMVAPWTGTDEPQDMDADQTEQMKQQSDITGKLWKWKDKVQSLKLADKEDMEGTEVYKLKMTDKPKKNKNDTIEAKKGDVSYIYIDADNFVVLKIVSKKNIRGTEMEFENYESNYKDVDGILFPFSLETKMKGQTVNQISIDTVKFNVNMDDAIFVRPDKKEKGEK